MHATRYLSWLSALSVLCVAVSLALAADQPGDLGNALALNSTMTTGARLVGPTIAGLMIVSVGEGRCFLLNGLSYLAILAAIKARPHLG